MPGLFKTAFPCHARPSIWHDFASPTLTTRSRRAPAPARRGRAKAGRPFACPDVRRGRSNDTQTPTACPARCGIAPIPSARNRSTAWLGAAEPAGKTLVRGMAHDRHTGGPTACQPLHLTPPGPAGEQVPLMKRIARPVSPLWPISFAAQSDNRYTWPNNGSEFPERGLAITTRYQEPGRTP